MCCGDIKPKTALNSVREHYLKGYTWVTLDGGFLDKLIKAVILGPSDLLPHVRFLWRGKRKKKELVNRALADWGWELEVCVYVCVCVLPTQGEKA